MDIKKLSERLEAMEHRARITEQRLRWWRNLACALLVLGLVILPLVGGTAQEQSTYERALMRRLATLEYKLQYITGGPNEVVISGANLRIVNGLGTTETTNGLGNLIVGYNELRMQVLGCPGSPDPFCKDDVRTGSHNVVLGEGNNFSSFGGLIVGAFNEISGDFASVSGGVSNTASGRFSSVSGGGGNTASGNGSSVSGGEGNTASGNSSSVSGGTQNTASGDLGASVSGGNFNTASGFFSSVSGGSSNTASGVFSSVSGGNNNIASGRWASVSGGSVNTASGDDSSVSGGFRNTASGLLSSSVSGGQENTASGIRSSVSGGLNRTAPGQFNWAAGPLFAAQ